MPKPEREYSRSAAAHAKDSALRVPVDHQAGQVKSELFEELISRIAEKAFPGSNIFRNFILRRKTSSGNEGPTSIDLVVETPNAEFVIIESKVPYTASPSHGINRTIRNLKDVIPRLQKEHKISKAILAVGAELPASSVSEIDQARKFFDSKGIPFEVWDSKAIHFLTLKFLNSRVPEFSSENLRRLLGKADVEETGKQEVVPKAVESSETLQSNILLPGEHSKVVVLCADFCSYSKFVHASGNDKDLVISIMGRFYRETRQAILSEGGKVDKFMGDGVLAFWPINGEDDKLWNRLNRCLKQLIGISLNLATEWQDQIDLAVNPKGLRAGAAIGSILMISESTKPASPIHAIGECINIAARLQGEANPNTLLISNKLKSVFAEDGDDFQKLDPKTLKNIGEAIVWEKDYGNGV